MELVQAIVCIVLTVVFFFAFHMCFTRIYVGSICSGILQELLVSFLLAGVVTAVIFYLGGMVLGWVGSVLLFLLKAVLWIMVIGAALSGAYWLYEKFVKKETDPEEEKEEHHEE